MHQHFEECVVYLVNSGTVISKDWRPVFQFLSDAQFFATSSLPMNAELCRPGSGLELTLNYDLDVALAAKEFRNAQFLVRADPAGSIINALAFRWANWIRSDYGDKTGALVFASLVYPKEMPFGPEESAEMSIRETLLPRFPSYKALIALAQKKDADGELLNPEYSLPWFSRLLSSLDEIDLQASGTVAPVKYFQDLFERKGYRGSRPYGGERTTQYIVTATVHTTPLEFTQGRNSDRVLRYIKPLIVSGSEMPWNASSGYLVLDLLNFDAYASPVVDRQMAGVMIDQNRFASALLLKPDTANRIRADIRLIRQAATLLNSNPG